MRPTLVVGLLFALLACGGESPGLPGDDLPLFRIEPPDPGTEREFTACYVPTEKGPELRLLYEPEGGGSRVKLLSSKDYEVPWPAGLSKDPSEVRMVFWTPLRRPAVVLCADAGFPWNRLMHARPRDEYSEHPRLFLAGRTADGRTGALPMLVLPPTVESRIGPTLMLDDVVSRANPDAVLEIRITRDDGRTRYRWGRRPPCYRPSPTRKGGRWAAGDVVLTDREVQGAGQGPLLPDLARFLTARHVAFGKPSIAFVYLQASDTVRVVDVFRAMECAAGDREVCFLPEVGRHAGALSFLDPPPPPSIDPPMTDYGWWGTRLVVNVTADATIRVKGDRYDLEGLTKKLAERAPIRILLRADRRLRWATVRPIVRAIRETGCELELCFDVEAPGLPDELELPVPRPSGTGRIVTISNEDRSVAEVWAAVHDALAGGAAAVEFE